MMQVEFGAGVCGRQNVQVLKNGEVVLESGFHKNMILNSYFNFLFTTGAQNSVSFQTVAVGAGTTPPAITQTGPVTFLAGKTGADSMVFTNLGEIAGNRVSKCTRTFTFAESAVVGNVSEVCTAIDQIIPNAGSTYHTRALVLNNQGVPTAIPVGAGEQLRVIHELELRLPLVKSSAQYSVTTGGVTTNHLVELAPTCVTNRNHCADMLFSINFRNPSPSLGFGWPCSAFEFSPTFTEPTFTNMTPGNFPGVQTRLGSTGVRMTMTLPSTSGNSVNGLAGVSLGNTAPSNDPFGLKFTPPLPKNNLNKLTIAVDFVFTRL